MLKKFFLNVLSSFAGAWIALLGFGLLLVLVAVAMMGRIGATMMKSSASVGKHSILKIELKGSIREVERSRGFDYSMLMSGDIERPQALNVLVQGLADAKVDKNIEAVYLDCAGVSASPATLHALREAVVDFRKSGKPVYAYGDSYSLGDYYVASCADSLFVNPQGEMGLRGLGAVSIYMGELFRKLGIEFQVAKVGTFKSAVEPYIMDEMSVPARAQLDTLYSNLWSFIRNEIAVSRKLKPAAIDTLVSRTLIAFAPASEAVKSRLADRAVYRREMNAILGRVAGVESDEVNFVSADVVSGAADWADAYSSDSRVAVLYATGEIAEDSKDGIDCGTLVPVITELADDDKVKAMVLRVNSPGGSVFGSSEIGEALDYFKSKGKPLAVSMGDYAASGGYWISCGADRIFADPLTITGSIGIFGLFPNVSGLLGRLGVSPQFVTTNPAAAFPGLFRPMDSEQLGVMQKYIERGYDQFVNRVAKGRHMSESKVRAIAEGRVWDAVKARKIGLVDELGSLDKALEWVARKAGLGDNYDAALYPRLEPSIWDMIPSAATVRMEKMIRGAYGREIVDETMLRRAAEIVTRKPVQARMPSFEVRL